MTCSKMWPPGQENCHPRTLYVNSNAYWNSEEKQEKLLAVIEQGRTVKKIGGGFLGAGKYYLIE